jgi:predicted DNA-binding protein (UPF0251 family)
MYKRRRRRGRQGRPPSPVFISHTPNVNYFNPFPPTENESINLEREELEVLRLVDLVGLSQEEAGEKMMISRGTIWRLLQRGRKKVTQALVEGRKLVLQQHEAYKP